ncbi:acyl-CoA carboxylase epsilon subunit [Kitasatospora sp. NPDC048365]|uniref:acyl-CoA carboxylase epsilon subunit n=1 Tax=Kitasatospora sp. NPDC048365 TaxID=3364050 RepID=UPI0037233C1E
MTTATPEELVLKVVRGNPHPEEIAIATAALLALARIRAAAGHPADGPGRTRPTGTGWHPDPDYGPPGSWAA